jgi:hypothetical protein
MSIPISSGRDERLEDVRDRFQGALRHRILKNLGLGRQFQGGKVLDAFIKEPERMKLR